MGGTCYIEKSKQLVESDDLHQTTSDENYAIQWMYFFHDIASSQEAKPPDAALACWWRDPQLTLGGVRLTGSLPELGFGDPSWSLKGRQAKALPPRHQPAS